MTRFVATGFLSLFAFSWLVCGFARAAEPIRIAYSSVNPHALLAWVAEKRGLYAKYGLSSVLVYVPGGSVAIQALVSGDIDLAQLTGPPGVIANMKGADVVYIAMTDDKMGYQLVTRQDIKKAADLKGKNLASAGSVLPLISARGSYSKKLASIPRK